MQRYSFKKRPKIGTKKKKRMFLSKKRKIFQKDLFEKKKGKEKYVTIKEAIGEMFYIFKSNHYIEIFAVDYQTKGKLFYATLPERFLCQ